ncbi:MAG: ComEC/Rec2 family competence protein [Candidatus Pacebacteria bacterium]|nr:ComEC/Rec2 family competence protein [Candidatus Paceibacterota bacterium]
MVRAGQFWRWCRLGGAWLREELSFHRERFVLFLPVFFGLGIILYFNLKFEPPGLIAVITTLGLWLLAILFRRHSLVMRILVILAMAASGFAVSQWRTHGLQAVVVQQPLGPIGLSGRIAAIDHRAHGQRFILTNVTAIDDSAESLPPVLRITTRGGLERDTGVGDWVQFRAVLTPLRPPSVVGGFDYQFYGYFFGLNHGIGGGGFMVSGLRYIDPPTDYDPGLWQSLFNLIDAYRWRMSYWLIQEIEGDAGAMAAALVGGDQGQIAPPILQSMRDSGLAHILSISGLHISLAAIIVILVVRGGLALIPYCALYWPLKQIAGAAGLVAAIGYGLLAGINQVPVLRSLVMLGVMLLAMILGRRALSLLTLAWAAMISLILTPEQLLGPSFQLSFAAVLVLVTLAEVYQLSLADGFDTGLVRRLRLWLVFSLVSSVAVTVATTPTSAYIFHRTAIYGVFANLLAVPLSDFIIMPLVVGELLLYPLGWDGWLHRPLGWSIDGLIALSRFFAELPQAVIYSRAFSGGAFALMIAGGLWLCLWRGSLRWLGIGVAAVGLGMAIWTPPPRLIIGGDGRNFAYLRPEGQMVLARGG